MVAGVAEAVEGGGAEGQVADDVESGEIEVGGEVDGCPLEFGGVGVGVGKGEAVWGDADDVAVLFVEGEYDMGKATSQSGEGVWEVRGAHSFGPGTARRGWKKRLLSAWRITKRITYETTEYWSLDWRGRAGSGNGSPSQRQQRPTEKDVRPS